jgi:signal transduction histidine kinase
MQAIGNLLGNAIKYAPSGGTVGLSAQAAASGMEATVKDDGPGIPAEDARPGIGRFVRLEASRTTPGHGLGLSIVRAVAQMPGAKLNLSDA